MTTASQQPNLELLRELLYFMGGGGIAGLGASPSDILTYQQSFMRAAEIGRTPTTYTWRTVDGKPREVAGWTLANCDAIHALETAPDYVGNKPIRILSPLHLTISSRTDDLLEWALRHGYNPNHEFPGIGSTPMSYAAICGRVDILEKMWLAGAIFSCTWRGFLGKSETIPILAAPYCTAS